MLGNDYDVLIELDPRAALDRLRANEHFDAVLCDLMMPQMSGIDVFDELERARPTLARRMGFMTGGAFTPRAREFLEKHQTRLLEKPFTADALKTMVRKLVTL
jgi:CheY-like chemotaxis protein